MTDFDLLLVHGRVVTCSGPTDASPIARLAVVEDGAVGVVGDRIAWVGESAQAPLRVAGRRIDVAGRVVLPGLVDPHTHLVFAGSRTAEFAQKMAGESYASIAASGGGIMATVRATRAASEEDLLATARARALEMRSHGVTTVEVKSGYGLTLDDEEKLLRVGRALARTVVVRTTTTFLGAHVVPTDRDSDRAGYVDEVATKMIPEVVRLGLADSFDAYIDEGAFSVAEARTVFDAAKRAGLPVRAHIGQFRDVGGAELLAGYAALSADHLENLSDAGARALARSGTVGVLLPGAWRTLRQAPPDASRLRGAGMRLAVGTDSNPGTSPCTDLTLCVALAVRDAGLPPADGLLAVTVDAAAAAGVPNAGVLRPGAHADLAVFPTDDPASLGYVLGGLRAEILVLGGACVVGPDAAPRTRIW